MMRQLFAGCFWIFFSVTTSAGIPCKVWLLNGDHFDAAYVGQEGEESVFECYWQQSPVRIPGKYIYAIDFGVKSTTFVGDKILYFDNGQWIRGQILGLKDDQLTLKTAWVDAVEMDLGYIKKIERAIPQEDILYQGSFDAKDGRRFSVKKTSDLNKTPTKAWRLPFGESVIPLPRIEGSFGLQLVFQLPAYQKGGINGFYLSWFPEIRQAGWSEDRTMRFYFTGNGMETHGQKFMHIRRGLMLNPSQSVPQLPVSGSKLLVVTVEYDEPKNLTRVKVGDEILIESEVGGHENTNVISKPALTFFIEPNSEAYWLREFYFYKHPTLLQRDLMEDGETVFFSNGDAFKAKWQGIDGDGKWLLKGETLSKITPMDPSRIYAWDNASQNLKPMLRKSSHVVIQLAGGGEVFMVEFLKADAENLYFRREGMQGDFSIPFSQIERLVFNPYYR